MLGKIKIPYLDSKYLVRFSLQSSRGVAILRPHLQDNGLRRKPIYQLLTGGLAGNSCDTGGHGGYQLPSTAGHLFHPLRSLNCGLPNISICASR